MLALVFPIVPVVQEARVLSEAAVWFDAIHLDTGLDDHLTMHASVCLQEQCHVAHSNGEIDPNCRHVEDVSTADVTRLRVVVEGAVCAGGHMCAVAGLRWREGVIEEQTRLYDEFWNEDHL